MHSGLSESCWKSCNFMWYFMLYCLLACSSTTFPGMPAILVCTPCGKQLDLGDSVQYQVKTPFLLCCHSSVKHNVQNHRKYGEKLSCCNSLMMCLRTFEGLFPQSKNSIFLLRQFWKFTHIWKHQLNFHLKLQYNCSTFSHLNEKVQFCVTRSPTCSRRH